MPFFPSMPEDATTKQVFTAHPEIYSHWVHVSEAILRGSSPLTPAERELIGAYVSSLNACEYCYGGHRAAVGLTLDTHEFPRFKERLIEAARLVPELQGRPERKLQIDAVAGLAEVDFPLLEWLDRMEPFGRGNQEPILAVRGRIAGPVRVLKNRHLKFEVTGEGVRRECIGFNLSERAPDLDGSDGEIHLAVHATRNVYRGEERLQLSVRDIAVEDPFGNG